MLDSGRHKTGVFHNAVGDTDFFGNQGVVVKLEGLARARQIIELTARGCGRNSLFDQGI